MRKPFRMHSKIEKMKILLLDRTALRIRYKRRVCLPHSIASLSHIQFPISFLASILPSISISPFGKSQIFNSFTMNSTPCSNFSRRCLLHKRLFCCDKCLLPPGMIPVRCKCVLLGKCICEDCKNYCKRQTSGQKQELSRVDNRVSMVKGDAQGELIIIWRFYKHQDSKKATKKAVETVGRFSKGAPNLDHLEQKLANAWDQDVNMRENTDFRFIQQVIGEMM